MQQFSIHDLCYYFDGERRDDLDRGGAARRTGQFLALRQKVLALPDEQFDLVIQTVQNMLKPAPQKSGETPREGLELFQRSRYSDPQDQN